MLVLSAVPAAQGQPAVTINVSRAEYVLNGHFPGVLVNATEVWPTTMSMVIYVTLKSGTSTYIADGTTTLNPGDTVTVFCMDLLPVPPGVYNATFAAVTLSDFSVSAPLPPVTLVVTPAESN